MRKPSQTNDGTTEERDLQVKEFESKDLGDDIEASGVKLVARRSVPTSIALPATLKAKLKEKAERKGIGYQTLAKMILTEHIDDY